MGVGDGCCLAASDLALGISIAEELLDCGGATVCGGAAAGVVFFVEEWEANRRCFKEIIS